MKHDRRNFLKGVTVSSLAATGLGPQLSRKGKTAKSGVPGFKYKVGYLWLPQMSSRPFKSVFSSELDDQLIEDYRRYLPRVREAGFDYIVIFGLLGEGDPNQVPADLSQGFSPQRERQIHQMIDLIHQAGLKFLNGLGVYSWGFKNIIAAHPEVAARKYKFRGIDTYIRRSNAVLIGEYDRLDEGEIKADPDIMCATKEASWKWQEQVVRFFLNRYDLDGFHMESADRGRCWCPQCRKIDNIAYHARINERTTRLIKQLAPDKVVGISTCGLVLEGLRDLPALRQMARGADYLADYNEYHFTHDPLKANRQQVWFNDRPAVAREVGPLAFGTMIHLRDAGLDRLTWFTPAPQTIVMIIGNAYRDGCRALEYYAMGAFNNPGHELNNYVAGHALSHPDQNWHEVLEAVVDRLYRPRSAKARKDLVELFRNAEMSCLANDIAFNMVHKVTAPVPYLYDVIPYKQLRHQKELENHLKEGRRLEPLLGDKERAQRLVKCLEGTIATLQQHLRKTLEGFSS